MPLTFDYSRRPKKKEAAAAGFNPMAKPAPGSTKYNLTRRMENLRRPGQKNSRAVQMSIEGRGTH